MRTTEWRLIIGCIVAAALAYAGAEVALRTTGSIIWAMQVALFVTWAVMVPAALWATRGER